MLFALAGILYLLAIALSIVSLVCFILVLVQMFKRDQANLGIICIVLTLCTGVGPLVAFIYGWMKATEWNLKKVMTYWTVAIVLQLICIAIAVASAIGGAATMDPNQFNTDPNNMNFEFETDGSGFSIPEGFNTPTEAPQPDSGVLQPESDSLLPLEVTPPEASPTDQP